LETSPDVRPDLHSLTPDAWSVIHARFARQQKPVAALAVDAAPPSLAGASPKHVEQSALAPVGDQVRVEPSPVLAEETPPPAEEASSELAQGTASAEATPGQMGKASVAALTLPKAEAEKNVVGPLPSSGHWQFEPMEPGLAESAPSELEVPKPELSGNHGGAFASGSTGSGASLQSSMLPGGIRRDPAQPKEAYIRDLKEAINAKEAKLKALAMKIQELTNASNLSNASP